VTWQALRRAVLERAEVRGADVCPVLSAAADGWLAELFARAVREDLTGLALIAVGGHGRRELCPGSDFDLLLVHDGRRDIGQVADALWYPIWDAGVRLDHAVRRPVEAVRAAGEDLRVQLGLLDARLVAGDAALAERLAAEARAQWARRVLAWLPTLVEQVEQRQADHGDLAFLLEPELKESHGGLRDAEVVAAVASALPGMEGQIDLAALAWARRRLLDVRVELHRLDERGGDRLLLQAQDDVAAALGVADADALMADVAAAGRSVAWMVEELGRRLAAAVQAPRRRWRRAVGQQAITPPARTRVEPGVVVLRGPTGPVEVTVDDDQSDGDPSLPVRLAAVAAERGVPIDRRALERLAASPVTVPEPWPDSVRHAFVRLLGAGTPAVPAVEALDRHGLWAQLLPEWDAVRNRPQRNAYHRFTVDRHLLEAATQAAPLALTSPRPDLLLVGALLHDIGKGRPGDHSTVGQQLAEHIAARMGFGAPDRAVVGTLVRLHLLLPDAATRRDLDDPATVTAVADAVGDVTTLSLLAALAEADGLATGPSAWGPWKAQLVAELVRRVRQVLLGGSPPPTSPAHPVTERHRRLMAQARRLGRSVLVAEDERLTVVAEDRPGLLATVAGVLALFGLDVRSADVAGEDGFAIEQFVVAPVAGRWPDWTRVADDVEAALRGTLALPARLRERAAAYRPLRRTTVTRPVATRVTVDPAASTHATVVEVRTADGIGVLHQLTSAVFASGLDVVSARVSTLGNEVVDAFYVRDPATGGPVTDPDTLRRLERALVEAVEQPG